MGAHEVVEPAALRVSGRDRTTGAADVFLDCGLSLVVEDVEGWLAPKGTFLTITAPPDEAAAQRAGITAGHLFSTPDGGRLNDVARLLMDGTWTPPRVSIGAMADAPELQRRMREGGGHRLCLAVAGS
jgi:hypothetical protein